MLLKPSECLPESFSSQTLRPLQRPFDIGVSVPDLDSPIATHDNQKLPISSPRDLGETRVTSQYPILDVEGETATDLILERLPDPYIRVLG
jgi:hypothetical protein